MVNMAEHFMKRVTIESIGCVMIYLFIILYKDLNKLLSPEYILIHLINLT